MTACTQEIAPIFGYRAGYRAPKSMILEPCTQMPLSDLKVRKAKQQDKPSRLGDGLGLFLLVRPSGTKAWQFRYQFMGKEKVLTIGQYPIVSLAGARQADSDLLLKAYNEILVSLRHRTKDNAERQYERSLNVLRRIAEIGRLNGISPESESQEGS